MEYIFLPCDIRLELFLGFLNTYWKALVPPEFFDHFSQMFIFYHNMTLTTGQNLFFSKDLIFRKNTASHCVTWAY